MSGFDLGAGAVGFASLGIQIFQGLLAYYDSWKGYHDDIEITCLLLKDLEIIFKKLESLLKRSDDFDQSRLGTVNQVAKTFAAALAPLKQQWDDIRNKEKHYPHGWRQKTWFELHRAFYPFKEKTLLKVKQNVIELRSNLGTAVQTLQLDLDFETQDSFLEILKSLGEVSGKADTIRGDLSAINNKTDAIQVDLSTLVSRTDTNTTQLGRICRDADAVKLKGLLRWLSPTDQKSYHESICQLREAETGQWFLEAPSYLKWLASSHGLLWINGKSGCGKTVLCSTVIEDIKAKVKADPDTLFFYFYLSFSQEVMQTLTGMLKALVSQSARLYSVFSVLKEEEEQNSTGSISPKVLQDLCSIILQGSKRVILVIDALDEVPESRDEREKVIKWLRTTLKLHENVKAVVTSRFILDIAENMTAMEAETVSIDTAEIEPDISRYVQAQLDEHTNFRRLSGRMKQEIKRTLVSKANGMFRWAFLQLETLKQVKGLRDSVINDVLTDLPEGLDATYTRMLESINKRDRKVALTALRWLAVEMHPLTAAQLVDACIIDIETRTVNFDDRGDPSNIPRILGALILVEPPRTGMSERTSSTTAHHAQADVQGDAPSGDISSESGKSRQLLRANTTSANPTNDDKLSSLERANDGESSLNHVHPASRIRLAHFSVQEYLVSVHAFDGFRLTGTHNQSIISRSCALYLLVCYNNVVMSRFCDCDQCFPLLQYAATSCFRLLPKEDVLSSDDFMVKLLALASTREFWWKYSWSWRNNETPHALWCACRSGNISLVQHMLSLGEDIDAQSEIHGTALAEASQAGHFSIVQLLLECGADTNVRTRFGSPALVAASGAGYDNVVQLLLTYGADVSACSELNESALEVASGVGHLTTVQVLMDYSAKQSSSALIVEQILEALTAASRHGHVKIVQLLLDHGANANAQGGSALAAASRAGHHSIAALLLDYGADVNAQDSLYRNALVAASEAGHDSIAELLLDYGAEVNAQDDVHGNALAAASSAGHLSIAQLLLDHSADVNAPIQHHGSVLAAAARGPRIDATVPLVRLLLDHGPDYNAQFNAGLDCSALCAAARCGNLEAVKLLLEHGADANTLVDSCDSALVAAIIGDGNEIHDIDGGLGRTDIVKLLLEYKADVNLQSTGKYGSPLAAAAACKGREDIVQLLLDHDADVNIQLNRGYGSALTAAVLRGYAGVVQLLLDHKADVNMQLSGRYGSALATAASTGRAEVVQLLLDHKAEVNMQLNGEYGSALAAAASTGKVKVVQLLLKSGAKVNPPTHGTYGSPLAAAAHFGHVEVMKLILDEGTIVNAEIEGGFGTALAAAAAHNVDKHRAHFMLKQWRDLEDAAALTWNDEAVRLLLRYGADVNAGLGNRPTALDLAIQKDNWKIIRLLRDAGAVASDEQDDDASLAGTSPPGRVDEDCLTTALPVSNWDKFCEFGGGSFPQYDTSRFADDEHESFYELIEYCKSPY